MTSPPTGHIVVEIAPGGDPADPLTWVWVDVTDKVMVADGIDIEYGRRDESSQVGPSKCTLLVKNDDGRFSPRNPLGQWFGQLALNTPLRVRWDAAERFVGFVSEWPTRWLGLVDNSRVPIVANGTLRRLGTVVNQPLPSALYRATTSNGAIPDAYWPCEDGPDSAFAAEAFGRPSLLPRPTSSSEGPIKFGSELHPPGSSGAVDLTGGWVLTGPVGSTGTTAWTWECWHNSADGTGGNWTINAQGGTGSHVRFRILNGTLLSGAPGYMITAFFDAEVGGFTDIFGNFQTVAFVAYPSSVIGDHHFALRCTGSGSNTTFRWYLDGTQINESLEAITLNMPTAYQANGQAICQMAFWPTALTDAEVMTRHNLGRGRPGELAADRITRLSAESDVTLTLTGTAADTPRMGPQLPLPLLDLLHECEAADGGVLFEAGAGLAYRTRADRYNQAPALALSASGGTSDIFGAPEPTDDDQSIRNVITAQRQGGSSATVEDAASIATVGQYDESVTVNVEADDILANIAGWRLHLGTVDEMRWPSITLELANHDHLIPAWLAFQLGNRITVTNGFPQLPGVTIDLLVEGWRETFSSHRWMVELNCVPASPWRVGVIGDGILGRLDTAGATLAAGVTSTDTSLSVATSTGPLWTTAAGEVPFDIAVGGEVIRVTAVSGATSPQSFTVTRSINSIEKAHSAGAVVKLAQPLVLAL